MDYQHAKCHRDRLRNDGDHYGVIRGHRDLLYDPKGHGDLFGRFDPVYDLQRSWGQ